MLELARKYRREDPAYCIYVRVQSTRYFVVRIVYQVGMYLYVCGIRVDTLHLPDLPGQLALSCTHVILCTRYTSIRLYLVYNTSEYILRSIYVRLKGVISGICILRLLQTACLSAQEPSAADRYRNLVGRKTSPGRRF